MSPDESHVFVSDSGHHTIKAIEIATGKVGVGVGAGVGVGVLLGTYIRTHNCTSQCPGTHADAQTRTHAHTHTRTHAHTKR